MKLKDKTTVKTLREMIGKKIRTRTSRTTVEITSIELEEDETWFIGHEAGGRKRRIPLKWIHELIEITEKEEIPPKPRKKKNDEEEDPLEETKEKLKKLEEKWDPLTQDPPESPPHGWL